MNSVLSLNQMKNQFKLLWYSTLVLLTLFIFLGRNIVTFIKRSFLLLMAMTLGVLGPLQGQSSLQQNIKKEEKDMDESQLGHHPSSYLDNFQE